MTKNTETARPYAKAIFSFAKNQQQLQIWLETLQSFSKLISGTKLLVLASNPNCSRQRFLELIQNIYGQKTPEHFLSLINLLSRKRKLSLIPEITTELLNLINQNLQLIKINVTVAQPLEEQQKEQLQQSLTKHFKTKVQLEYQTNPAILAGIILHQNGNVLDASLSGTLCRLGSLLQK